MTKTATQPGVVPQEGKKLTPKQLRFVDEYLIDLNASAAARRAGYSAKTADVIGYENLQKPQIAQAIEAKRKELAAKAGITRERILDEMAKIAFADLRELWDENGRLKDPSEWPDGAAGAVAGMDITEEKADGQVIGYTKKLKLWDKGKQLENLLKHLGMAEDKPAAPETSAVVLPAQLQAVLDRAAKITAAPAAQP